MKLATFTHEGRTHLGAVIDDAIADLGSMPAELTLRDLLADPTDLEASARAAIKRSSRLLLSEVSLQAPIANPVHFFAVGLNYRDHARETGHALPDRPRLFTKLTSSITGPNSAIVHPGFSDTLDYEGELGIVIGRLCHRVSRAKARDYVAGYLIVNDLSIREWVTPDLLVLGKGCPTFAPLGPWLTSADEIADPHALQIRTSVNGELRQDASTAGMIFDCWTLIEWISAAVVLQPGDIITTGSPPGSGIGFSPPRYLQSGDAVTVAIDGLGAIKNQVC